MKQTTNKRLSNTRLTLILCAISVVLSFVIWVIFQFAVGAEKLGFYPILTLFIALFFFLAVSFVVDVITKRSVASTFLAFICGYLSIMFLLLALKAKAILIIVLGCVFVILALLTPMIFKAKYFTISFDNAPEKERLTYDEKKEIEKTEPQLEEEELPKLKSFKD